MIVERVCAGAGTASASTVTSPTASAAASALAVRRVHAVGPPAVGDHLDARRQGTQVAAQLGDGRRARPPDMPGLVLCRRPDVEHHDLAALEPGRQLLPADDLDAVPLAQVGASQLLKPGYVRGRHVPHRRAQLVHPVAGQPVEDTRPVAACRKQPRPGHRPQVMRGVGDALADLGGDLLNRPLTLGEQISDLGPASAGEGLRDLGEGIEQRILGSPVTHALMIGAEPRPCQIFV